MGIERPAAPAVPDAPPAGCLDVLAVSHSSTLYGAQRSLLDLVRGLTATGARVRAMLPGAGPLQRELESAGAEVLLRRYRGWLRQERLPLRPWLRMAINAAAVRALARQLRADPPAVVYSNSLATPVGAMIARELHLPHVWHARESVRLQQSATYDPGDARALRFIRDTSAYVVCNSEAIRRELAPHIPEDRLSVVYNGLVDGEMMRRFSPRGLTWRPGERPLELVHAASIARSKGHPDAIRAVACLKSRGVEVRLRVAGTGSAALLRELQALARRLGVAGDIVWEGFCTDVPALLARCDIALVCSPFEAFGRVAVEAMAAGTPVVVSGGGGLTEIVEDGKNGLTYPPADAEALAEKILLLSFDPDLYSLLSATAFQDVYRRFSKQRYVQEMTGILWNTASGKGCRPGSPQD